ncbi:MAG TPA: hypothetical protein DCK98_00700 [Chloroflexi bacterium]|jgi:hypothetical protein|nr:hypothetical protein [Chloroflexota bacterium]HAL27064.1 hypothetical protein [Chloroflexota bacterium]
MRALVLLALILLILASCGSSTAPSSGIRGTILAGPACPGPARLDSPCPDRPASMTVEVLSGTAIAATFTTDAAGTFSVSVAPGTYTLRSKNGLPTLKSSTVVVAAGEYTDVELHADTGIR